MSLRRHRVRSLAGVVVAGGLAGLIAGCTPAAPEQDYFAFVDVWTSATPAKKGRPAEYIVFQGDLSVCQVTVHSAKDADYASGHYEIADNHLTLKIRLHDGVIRSTSYTILSAKRGALDLVEISPVAGQRLTLVHTRAYSSCSDAQTRFGYDLKIL